MLKLYPEDALQLLENMTSNSYRAHERSPPPKQLTSAETSQFSEFSSKITKQLEQLSRQVSTMALSNKEAQVKAVNSVLWNYKLCGEAHPMNQCPVVDQEKRLSEKVSYIANQGRRQHNHYSNTYNLSWRNHPNFP